MTDPTRLLSEFRPDLRPPQFAATDVAYVVEDTVLGRMLLARKASGALVASAFVPDDAAEQHTLMRLSAAVSPRILRGARELDDARRQLEDYLAGRRTRFELETDLALASAFQQQVLPRLAASVGYGHTATYGQLAAALDRPRAARAVGAALGANPLCVVLPCHRVVESDGGIGGFGGGLEIKRALLALEGVLPEPLF